MYNGIIADLTVFNNAERLRTCLRAASRDYRVAIASDIYSLIRKENWEDLSALLCNWEWNVKRDKLIKWHTSSEFRATCKDAIGLFSPCIETMEKLSDEESKVLQLVSQLIEQGSAKVVRVAKELILTSTVKNFPVLSFTRHAKRWFKTCKNVMILEFSDAKDTASKAKTEIKTRVNKAGWKGRIYLFIFSTATGKLLQEILPPPVGTVVGVIGGLVICVLTDGRKI